MFLGARREGRKPLAKHQVVVFQDHAIVVIDRIEPSAVAKEPVARSPEHPSETRVSIDSDHVKRVSRWISNVCNLLGQRLPSRPSTHEATLGLQKLVELRPGDPPFQPVPSILGLADLFHGNIAKTCVS